MRWGWGCEPCFAGDPAHVRSTPLHTWQWGTMHTDTRMVV